MWSGEGTRFSSEASYVLSATIPKNPMPIPRGFAAISVTLNARRIGWTYDSACNLLTLREIVPNIIRQARQTKEKYYWASTSPYIQPAPPPRGTL